MFQRPQAGAVFPCHLMSYILVSAGGNKTMANPGRKQKYSTPAIKQAVSLPSSLAAIIDATASDRGLSRSALITQIMATHLGHDLQQAS